MSLLRVFRNLPNAGGIFVRMRKIFDALFRTRARRHRDEYQPSLNSQLIRGRLNSPAATHGVRNHTGPPLQALAVYRGDDMQGRIAVDGIRVIGASALQGSVAGWAHAHVEERGSNSLS